MAKVAAYPRLRLVRHLDLDSSGLRDQHLPVLMNSPHLINVRVLDLRHNSIRSTGCEALAAATARRVPALRTLSLHNNPIGDNGLLALASADWFANLAGLYVSKCGVSDEALVRLAALPQIGRLRSLDVGWVTNADPVARAILDSPYLSGLERLWLWAGDPSPATHSELERRFGANLNLTSYSLD